MPQESREKLFARPEKNASVGPEAVAVEKSEAEQSLSENKVPKKPDSVPLNQAAVDSDAAYSPNEEYKKIEGILSDGLADLYNQLLPEDRALFKKKGEETASLIWKTISQPKVKIRKVIDLIKKWLQVIPGVNRFFLEQTAKIKADRIIEQISPGKKIV